MATLIQPPSDTSNNNKVRFASTGRPRSGDLRSSRQYRKSSMDSSSDVAAPSMYDTSTSESWSTSDGRTNPSSQQQQQSSFPTSTKAVSQYQYQRTNSSSQVHDVTTSRDYGPPQRYAKQQQRQAAAPAQQQQQQQPPSSSPNTSMSSASTRVFQNINYRKDYSRSQHEGPTAIAATMSEPGTPDERYAAYLTRVATFDPKTKEALLQQAIQEEEDAEERNRQQQQQQQQQQSQQLSSSRHGVYSSKNGKFQSSSNQSDSSTFSKNRFMEKKDSFLTPTSKLSVPSQSSSSAAAVAPSMDTRLQENRDSAPNRSRADRRARLEKLSSSMHSRARSSSRSITPNRETRGGGTTTTTTTTIPNKQVAWKNVETTQVKTFSSSIRQQQQQQQQPQHAHSRLTVNTAAPASPTADQIEQGEVIIETPSPAKVEELKRQLWSEDEQLKNWSQVSGEREMLAAARSNPQQQQQPRQPRHAKSLSPDRPQYRKSLRSERVAAAFRARSGGGGSSSDNEGASRVKDYHSYPNRPSSSSGAVQDGSSPNRVFRSRFYAAAIAAHRGKEPSIQPSPSMVNESNVNYQATTQNFPQQRGMEIARSNSTPSLHTNTIPTLSKGRVPATSPHITLQPTTSKNQYQQDMWRQAPTPAASTVAVARNEDSSIPITQSASTATSDNYVAKLVAKLNAVRRDNPSAALAQIDAILRAESQSSSGDRQEKLDQEVAAVQQQMQPTHRGVAEEMDSVEETTSSEEDETTVSSMTNPTFQSLRHNTDPDAAALVPHPSLHTLPKTHIAEVNGYATPYTMQQQQQQQQQQHPRHPWEAPQHEKALKPKKIKATPPPSIRVTSPKETTREHSTGVTSDVDESAAAARRLDRYIHNQQTSTLDPNNPADLAEKIRMWDEMSNPSVTQTQLREYQMSSGGLGVQTPPLEEVLSNATEDLGSIITPADQASSTTFSGSKLTGSHPWDNHHPTVRAAAEAVFMKDTSMLDGEGIETQPSRIQQQWRNQPANNATHKDSKINGAPLESSAIFDIDKRTPKTHVSSHAEESFGDSRRQTDTWNFSTPATQGHQVNAMSLSDEFDHAWVSLPPNAFFGRKGGARRSPPPDGKADLLTTTMFPGTTEAQWQKQQQTKSSLLPPEVTAAFEQVSLKTESKPRPKGTNVNHQKAETSQNLQKAETSRKLEEQAMPPLSSGDPWLHSKRLDVSGESQRSAGIEVSLLESPPPASSSIAPQTPKSSKSRLNFLRPILSRGRAHPATRNDGGDGVAYGSLSPKQQVLRTAQAVNTKTSQRESTFSPPRSRSDSLDEMGAATPGSKLKNKTLAKKFSRLMKVYDEKPGF